ncbi:MAG: hypothetical protein IPM81_17275 [Saprospirales bacterium]|nr:hypothetical protein [Saprospirales bacterium]
MKTLFLTCALFVFPAANACLQETYQKLFGNASQNNRCQAIEKLPDSTLVLAGDWADRGYLMTVDHSGALLEFLSLEGLIAGTSSISQVLTDADGNLLAAGECHHCLPGDTLRKVFVVRTSPDLQVLQSKIYDGLAPQKGIFDPRLARVGDAVVLAATADNSGWNFEDLTLLRLKPNLDTLWRKIYHSCDNCGFERIIGFTHTVDGFAAYLEHPFGDSLTMYRFTAGGDVVWKNRSPVMPDHRWYDLAYHNNTLYASAFVSSGAKTWQVNSYGLSDGAYQSTVSITDRPGVDKEGLKLRSAPDGKLLALAHIPVPNAFGTPTKQSFLYRIDPATKQVVGQVSIPPAYLSGDQLATAAVALNAEGSEFAVGGYVTPELQSFFFSVNKFAAEPFKITPDTACAPAVFTLTNQVAGATAYAWRLDSVLFSTAADPGPLAIATGGQHTIELRAVVPVAGNSDFLIDYFSVNSLPEIWNECAFCDNKPDPYIRIRDQTGQVVYVSQPIEDYPPTQLPVSYRLRGSKIYVLEVWDSDAFPPDDFFGAFDIPGNTPGGTMSVTNPEDPDTPLSITFSTVQLPAIDTVVFARVVWVSKPDVTSTVQNASSAGAADGSITVAAAPGGIQPYAYAWNTGAQTPALSHLAPGMYSLTVTDQLGCSSVFTFTVGVLVSTETAADAAISASIAPNPSGQDARAVLRVAGSAADGSALDVRVFDAAGRELWVQTALSGATCLLPQNLNPGAYLVAVQNRRSGAVKTLRWMVL